MKELRITDSELQAVIAPALRKFLAGKGFLMGTPSDSLTTYFFPIDVNLAGCVDVTRDADGVWTITQDEHGMAERVAVSAFEHGEAIASRIDKYGM